ncbi:uncharacterized protein LOC118488205 [Helianthus annuus]|uniref:uncharacterized protein LOC118488205 n=1 Tax=Helianthus annuus TaxID=4232 RepID=UPI0016530F6D|nr:uncharacterized protein LOC118488205 [Helianthus annuus]
MDNEFYNEFLRAFAPVAPVTVAETVGIENETRTFQKPLKSNNSPRRKSIFKSSESDEDTDDEEEYINKARKHLDPYSSNLYFADKIEILKEKRAAKLKREMEAKRVVEEKIEVQMEAGKAKVEEKPAEKVEVEENEVKIEVEKEPIVIEKVVEKIIEKIVEVEKILKENLLHNVRSIKESYDLLSSKVNLYKGAYDEDIQMKNLLKATVLQKQTAINKYIEIIAGLKQELAAMTIETERFADDEENSGKKTSLKYNRVPNPMWDGYTPRHFEKVAEALNLNLKSESIDGLPDNIDVTFIASDTGASSEEEKEKPFWNQSNKEFLAEKQKNVMMESEPKVERRTCFRCQEMADGKVKGVKEFYESKIVKPNDDGSPMIDQAWVLGFPGRFSVDCFEEFWLRNLKIRRLFVLEKR